MLCVYLFIINGSSIFNALFWFKLIILSLTVYHINHKKKAEFYYYKNLGLTKLKLFTITLSIDILIFLILLISIRFFK